MLFSIAEAPPFWAQNEPLEDFALTLGKSAKGAEERYQVVAAEKTIRLEIKE